MLVISIDNSVKFTFCQNMLKVNSQTILQIKMLSFTTCKAGKSTQIEHRTSRYDRNARGGI